jgi:hypothetical protein
MRVILPSHTETVQISELVREELDVVPQEMDMAEDHVVMTDWQSESNNIRLFNWKTKEFARLPNVSKHL